MGKKITVLIMALFALSAFALSAADLTIDMQVNTTAQDYANNYLTFTGAINSVAKDQFVAGADATTGASKQLSTEVFNGYRFDVKGKATLPSAIRNLLLYAVAPDSVRSGDNLLVTKASSGAITIRFIHRGTAFEIVTDAAGKIVLPMTSVKKRVVGHTDNTIGVDFSTTAKTANVDWAKVWNGGIADGKVVGTTTTKTGKVMTDVADSAIFIWEGSLQVSFDGKLLKISGGLNAKKL
jgi:hypothetical protein